MIGITGGIGSGKSTAAKVFSILGVPVFNSDREAKLCYSDKKFQGILWNQFGKQVFTNHQPDFKKIANLAFRNSQVIKWLNEQIHPMVAQKFSSWLLKQNTPYVLKEAAILFESGAYKNCNQLITVVASQKNRIDRVVKRDAVSEQQVMDRINHQWSDDQKIPLSDFIIYNNSELIIPQIIAIHNQLV